MNEGTLFVRFLSQAIMGKVEDLLTFAFCLKA